MTPERVRTGIIVSVVVGTLAILIIGYVLLKRHMNRGVKAGTIQGRPSYGDDRRITMVDKELEVGFIQEPLPVYAKDPREDEKRMALSDREEYQR